MTLFDPETIALRVPVLVTAHGRTARIGINDLHVSKRKGHPDRVTGFDAGGSSFDLDGRCKITPWVSASPAGPL